MQDIQTAIVSAVQKHVKIETRKTFSSVSSDLLHLKEDHHLHRQRICQLEEELAAVQKLINGNFPKITISRDEKAPSSRRHRVSAKGLIHLRERFGISQTAMAVLLGVTIQTVNRWEHGRIDFSASSVEKIVGLRKLSKKQVQRILETKKN